jgi:major intracellular serine protease
MKDEVRLIPYKVNEVYQDSTEIPEGVRNIGSLALWDKGFKGQSVVVAVLDTGVQVDHPDLKDRIIYGQNFTEDYSGDPMNFNDNNGHGTHVAGTIAATSNGLGVMGVAPMANLWVGKVLRGDGGGTYDGIIRGIHAAIDWRGSNGEKVNVINMSLGGSVDVPDLHIAIKRAVENNIVVVCAAGNEGDDDEATYEFAYPSAYNEVVEVGAVDNDKRLAYFSNNNIEIDCVAPGVDINSTYIGSKYALLSGTSMATPHVSGAIALLINQTQKEYNRNFSECELYAQLVKNCVPLGYRKSSEGNGLVKLDHAEKVRILLTFISQNF